MDAKWDLQISKALKVGSLPRGLKKLKIACLYKCNISGWVTLQPGTELRPVSFNKRQQNEELFFQKHSWHAYVSQFSIRKTISFYFRDANYAYATRRGILTKIQACKHLQKFSEHEQASTHLIFATNSSKGQILRTLSNWMGPFDTPSLQHNCILIEVKSYTESNLIQNQQYSI